MHYSKRGTTVVKQTLVVLRCLLSLLATHFLPIPNASKDKQLLQPKERFALKRRHRGPILHVMFFFFLLFFYTTKTNTVSREGRRSSEIRTNHVFETAIGNVQKVERASKSLGRPTAMT